LEAELDAAGVDSVDALVLRFGRSSLARHAADVETEARYGRRERPIEAKGARPLGAFDCIAAPCVEACPAHQEIPAYLTAVAAGDPASALSIIARTNAMPAVTGRACDHPCVDRCVRSHYDAPIAIREIKRFAVESCAPRPPVPTPELPAHADVAIVGAGPGGIATATFLARHGVRSVVLEARTEAGGMVSRTIPGYRMDRSAMAADLDALRALGIEVRFGTRLGRDLSIADLRARHRFVVLALGTQAGRKLGIPGEQAAGVMDALDLLERVNAGVPPSLGTRVLVVGGGNSAIDAARTARRLCPAGSVTLVYRRTRESMPADPDEIRDCLDEGVALRTLLAPQRVVLDAGRVVALACRPMRLGEPDASGRPRPVPLDGPDVELPCDTLVAAIGQEAVLDFDDAGLARASGGTVEVDDRTLETSLADTFAVGDLARGPSSIIRAIADGGIVADAIARRLGRAQSPAPPPRQRDATELLARRSRVESPRTVPLLPAAHRTQFEEVVGAFEPTDALAEAARCLECDALCSLCVTVCPNRAMQAYAVTPRVVDLPVLVTSEHGTLERHGSTRFEIAQSVQVACIADFCNECGDCVTFCPTAGAPWRDKPRFWISATGFAASDRDAYRWTHDADVLTLDARIAGKRHRIERHGPVALYRNDQIEARFDTASWAFLGAEPTGAPPANEPIDLSTCATLLALLDTATALPPPTRK
ncbi:MAG: FAD-dependent oxidoreductase, partial [Deltaproteobacteria bacterium]|nr:FAD-dependent oxidoreductase [Deltaproteobacteria bacterium]